MSEHREQKIVTKWMVSMMAERAWLEEMSLQGWLLKDIRWNGVRYVFEKAEEPIYITLLGIVKFPLRPEYIKAEYSIPSKELGRVIDSREEHSAKA